ncbi:MAG: TlpA disulfide reductase family protein [Planctomycetaceae bacterium]
MTAWIRLTAAGAFCVLLIALSVTPGFADEQAGTDAAPPLPELREGSWDDIQKLIAEHRGRVVVVDVWSTACLPCMREFPHLVSLQKLYGDRIVCVSLNLDYAGIKSKPPEYYRPRVEKFLVQQKAMLRNFLCTTAADQFFESSQLNSIPAVYVYGPDGRLAKRFDDTLLKPDQEDAFTYEADINPFVATLLKK